MAAADPGDLVEAGDGGIGVDGMDHEVGEGLACELVNDVEDLDHPAGGGDVELVVERPQVVGPGRLQPIRGGRGLAKALALAALRWHAQALLAPQTLDLHGGRVARTERTCETGIEQRSWRRSTPPGKSPRTDGASTMAYPLIRDSPWWPPHTPAFDARERPIIASPNAAADRHRTPAGGVRWVLSDGVGWRPLG